ncbi:MAG: helix-turn-helix transcriptional regulator [Actinomycetales bacterium]|nr:helix-turn-helix transcriptional regulator [Actinomycetales bacterium]
MKRDTERGIHELHARICKAIADPKRLLSINVLRDGPMTVNDIAESLELTQSNTSQHLAILRERNIVDTERDGRSVYYSLHNKKVLKAIDLLREFMADQLSDSSKLQRAADQMATSRR